MKINVETVFQVGCWEKNGEREREIVSDEGQDGIQDISSSVLCSLDTLSLACGSQHVFTRKNRGCVFISLSFSKY